MDKKRGILVVVLIVMIFLVAGLSIFLYNKEHRVEEIKKETKELVKDSVTIDDFKEKLLEAGIDIGAESENTDCDLVGASEGVSYTISEQDIQIYRFDFNKSDELTVSNLKRAQDDGKIILPSFNNIEIKIVYNKGLILISAEDHPEWERIVEVFNSL